MLSLRTGALAAGLLAGGLAALASQSGAPGKERALAGWSQFVGAWTVTGAEGTTSRTVITESSPGVFVHRGADFTVMVGWDAESDSMHAFGFSGDAPFEQYWELVDDQPTFAGRLLGSDQRFRWSIVDGVWSMDFDDFGRMTAVRSE